MVFFLYAANQLLEQGNIVAITRNMVTAAEVQPLHPMEVLPKLFLHGIKRLFKCIRPLLTERMKVQAVEPREKIGTKIRNLYAKA